MRFRVALSCVLFVCPACFSPTGGRPASSAARAFLLEREGARFPEPIFDAQLAPRGAAGPISFSRRAGVPIVLGDPPFEEAGDPRRRLFLRRLLPANASRGFLLIEFARVAGEAEVRWNGRRVSWRRGDGPLAVVVRDEGEGGAIELALRDVDGPGGEPAGLLGPMRIVPTGPAAITGVTAEAKEDGRTVWKLAVAGDAEGGRWRIVDARGRTLAEAGPGAVSVLSAGVLPEWRPADPQTVRLAVQWLDGSGAVVDQVFLRAALPVPPAEVAALRFGLAWRPDARGALGSIDEALETTIRTGAGFLAVRAPAPAALALEASRRGVVVFEVGDEAEAPPDPLRPCLVRVSPAQLPWPARGLSARRVVEQAEERARTTPPGRPASLAWVGDLQGAPAAVREAVALALAGLPPPRLDPPGGPVVDETLVRVETAPPLRPLSLLESAGAGGEEEAAWSDRPLRLVRAAPGEDVRLRAKAWAPAGRWSREVAAVFRGVRPIEPLRGEGGPAGVRRGFFAMDEARALRFLREGGLPTAQPAEVRMCATIGQALSADLPDVSPGGGLVVVETLWRADRTGVWRFRGEGDRPFRLEVAGRKVWVHDGSPLPTEGAVGLGAGLHRVRILLVTGDGGLRLAARPPRGAWGPAFEAGGALRRIG